MREELHRAGIDAWNIARPAVFLIDRHGIVRLIFVAERQEEFLSPADPALVLELQHIGRM